MFPSLLPGEVHNPYPSLMSASSMPHRDVASVISSTFPMTLLGERERHVRSAFPNVFVQGTDEMSNTGGSRRVAAQSNLEFRQRVAAIGLREGESLVRDIFYRAARMDGVDDLSVCSVEERWSELALLAQRAQGYPWLQHLHGV